MKNLLCGLFLLALMVSCTTSKRVSTFTMPEAVPVAATVDLDAYRAKYGKYDGVYLNNETTIEHYGTKSSGYNGLGASWNYVKLHKSKLLVFNPEVSWMTSFRIAGKPDQMYARVTTPDGRVRMYGLEDLRQEKDVDGYNWYTLVYPEIVSGTLIEEGYETKYAVDYFLPPLDHDIELQYSIPCEHMQVSFACPDWWTVAIKKLADKRVVPVVWDTTIDPGAKKQMFTYTRSDIPAVTEEPFAPYFKQVADYLQFQVTELEMKGFLRELPTNWDKLTEELNKYMLKKQDKGWEKVSDRAKVIAADCTTDLERLDAVVSFVRDSIESSPAGFDGNYPKVLEQKRGNVIEKCGLTQKLLAYLNIQSNLLLVHSAMEGYFDKAFISFDQFTALAVRARVEEVDYVVFPYVDRLPVNHVPEPFQNEIALQITGDLSSFWQVPPGNRAENGTLDEYDVTITDAGRLICRETRTANGSQAYDLREGMRKLDARQTEDFFREILAYQSGDLTIDSFTVQNQDAYKLPLVFVIYYTIDNLVTITPDEALFQTAGLFFPFNSKEMDRYPEDRVNPVSIPYDTRFEKAITVHFPEDWTVETPLNDVSYENLLGSLEGTYSLRPGELSVRQHVNLNRSLESREKFVELQELLGSRSKLQIPTIIFSVPEEADS
jgi:hypothetical protein